MAIGTGSDYWAEEQLPSVLKHELLAKYLPVFVGKLGHIHGKVFLVDGYAGEGEYASGAPGSARQMLQVASDLSRGGISTHVVLVERDSGSVKNLRAVVDRFPANPRVVVDVLQGDVERNLDEIVGRGAGFPLFLFLDPCGMVLPLSDLARVINSRPRYLATEVLINFSAQAVRRIGGHVTSPSPTAKTLAAMDATVGGDWWRAFYDCDDPGEMALRRVVDGYRARLYRVTGMGGGDIPVRKQPSYQPEYHLIFGTRNQAGLWHFSDSVARAQLQWWKTFVTRQDSGQLSLDGLAPSAEERLENLEAEAVDAIVENLAKLVANNPTGFCVGDHVVEVLDPFFGEVREKTVRAAIKRLHKEGRTSSTGVGNRIEKLRVRPPT